MTHAIALLVPFWVGVAMGIVYFTGLWVTVKHLPDSKRPFASLLGSFLVRSSLLVTGFAFLMNGRWEPLAAALLGFFLAREILIRRLGWAGLRRIPWKLWP